MLTEKIIAAWLKYDPFVRIITKGQNDIRHDAMTALLGENAAKKYFSKFPQKPLPKPVYPAQVRDQEIEFMESPVNRSLIIRQLIFWATDEYLNKENPDSHLTRIQIIQSLLGPIFIHSTSEEEKLIVDGLKVLVISRPTSLGRRGEPSPVVHREIISQIGNMLKKDHLARQGQTQHHVERALRGHLIKTIQGFKDSQSRYAYYVADDRKSARRRFPQKYPLAQHTKRALLETIRHYTFSSWYDYKQKAKALLEELHETS